MITVVTFPNWSDALEASELPERTRKAHRCVILWFLGYLKRVHGRATVAEARAFVEGLISERKPRDWQVEQWRAGLNWFFKEAPTRRKLQSACKAGGGERKVGVVVEATAGRDRRRQYPHSVAELRARVPVNPWYEEAVRLMRVRHMAYRTEETYLGWIRRMEAFLGAKDGLEGFAEGDLKRFLSYLAVEEGVSAATQRQALNAGVFFLREVRKFGLGDFSDYVKADPRKYYPVVYSRNEVKRLLSAMRGRWALMARLQYGCGLRISELCRLRVKDIDLERNKLYIRASKGDKDRCVPLPLSVREALVAHLGQVREVHDGDLAAGLPGVYLPGALERKMPQAGKRWEWFWVFPMEHLSKDPRAEAGAPKRRHHVLPGVYQRELSAAAAEAQIPKRSNSHILRHSYATHLLESGTNIRTVQEFLGHTCVETTMIYLHVMEDQRERALSPLDAVA